MKLNKFLLLAAVAKAQDAAAPSPELAKLLQGMSPEQIQALMANVKIPDKEEQAPEAPASPIADQPGDVDLDETLQIIPGETPPAGGEEIQELEEISAGEPEGIIQPEVGPPEVAATDVQSAIITQPASPVAAAPAVITASTVATSTLSTNTTTQAAPIEPVISALEPVDEIEPELSERLEDETVEDDRFKPVDDIITDTAAAAPEENSSPDLENSQSEETPDETQPLVPAASPALNSLDSMSAEQKNALLAQLLAAQSQPVAQQSADLLQGQVSAAQSALQAAEENAESNPEAPISDQAAPMMMTGTNPAVYADVPQSAEQPAEQPAGYPNEFGSRADPDIAEAPEALPVDDALPVSEGESEVESQPELISSESEAPMELNSNLGSEIPTEPDLSAPVSPELSEIPETSDFNSDVEEIAASIPDSPHLPIDLKTSNVDTADYETDEQFDEESVDMDDDEDNLEFDEDAEDNMEDEWDPYEDEEDEYDEYEDDYYEDEDDYDEYEADEWGDDDEWGNDEDGDFSIDNLEDQLGDDEGNQDDIAEARNHYEAMYNSRNEEAWNKEEQREEEIFDEAMDEGKAGYNFAFYMILFITIFTGGYYAYGKIKDKFFPQSTDQKYALLPKEDGDVKQSASSNDKPEAENWDNDW